VVIRFPCVIGGVCTQATKQDTGDSARSLVHGACLLIERHPIVHCLIGLVLEEPWMVRRILSSGVHHVDDSIVRAVPRSRVEARSRCDSFRPIAPGIRVLLAFAVLWIAG
jgi:hypothetical protein